MTTDEFRLTGSDVFGRYCLIEMKRFGVPNEFYIHKCIRSYRSNYYRDVPLKFGDGEYVHPGRCVDVVGVITCGLDEKEVFPVPLDSVEFKDQEEEVTCHDVRQGGGWFICSRCGALLADGAVTNATSAIRPRYCPNCGARVVDE